MLMAHKIALDLNDKQATCMVRALPTTGRLQTVLRFLVHQVQNFRNNHETPRPRQ
jgi:hypothetical protein